MITQATKGQIEIVRTIVYEVINEVYPNYYPTEVVVFFQNHHSKEHIAEDIEQGNVYLLSQGDVFVGTGSIDKNNMTRVFVRKEYQGKGYGTLLMDFLEGILFEKYDAIHIDSSLPAFNQYLKRGYISQNYSERIVENGRVLCYHTMIKQNEK